MGMIERTPTTGAGGAANSADSVNEFAGLREQDSGVAITTSGVAGMARA